MQVERSLVIKTRGGGIRHVIALATSLSESAAREKEWNMVQLATSHIPCVVSYDEKCRMQQDLREKQISLFGDYVLEIVKTTLM